jgi:hypothetical protein
VHRRRERVAWLIAATSGWNTNSDRNHGATVSRYVVSCGGPMTLSTVVARPATIAATSTTYIVLSFFVVAMNTGPVVRRR